MSDTTVATLPPVARNRKPWATAWFFTGPAVVASVAYMDPGNFATNIQAGAKYGYSLLWVVLAANLVAMLFQALSARLGIVTGLNLAELSRDHFPQPAPILMWIVSEIAAMATDLAEFLGASIGLALLFNISLFTGMAITAIITYGILAFGSSSARRIELLIGAFVATIGLCYVIELWIAPINWPAAASGLFTPFIADNEALMIAVGIVGATVMPHALFIHSALTQNRVPIGSEAERERVIRFSNREVVIALGIAGLVNMSMVIMASAAFNLGHTEVAEIETAYYTLGPLLGGAAAGVFLTSLIASGISSSVVGTMAGQVIIQGFIRRRIPIWLRRLIVMIPAFAVVLAGIEATRALVISQVVLSIALPVPMIALVILVRKPTLMGAFVPGKITQAAAIAGMVLVLILNAVLLYQTAFGA